MTRNMHKSSMEKNLLQQLSEQITNILEAAGGTWGISLFDSDTKESWELNKHNTFYAASVIKIPIMIAVFAASEQKEITLSNSLTLKREDMVGGSGVLQHMTPGTEYTIYDLITLMIIQSDNTATNMLIDLVGVEAVKGAMQDIGLRVSTFHHKMMTVEADREGFNVITAHEMTSVLHRLTTGKIISVHASAQMIDILKKQQIRHSLPAKIPGQDEPVIGALKQWELANKTGNITGIRHDIGIFYVGKRTFIASILSKEVDDLASTEIIAEIGLAIYNYLE